MYVFRRLPRSARTALALALALALTLAHATAVWAIYTLYTRSGEGQGGLRESSPPHHEGERAAPPRENSGKHRRRAVPAAEGVPEDAPRQGDGETRPETVKLDLSRMRAYYINLLLYKEVVCCSVTLMYERYTSFNTGSGQSANLSARRLDVLLFCLQAVLVKASLDPCRSKGRLNFFPSFFSSRNSSF